MRKVTRIAFVCTVLIVYSVPLSATEIPGWVMQAMDESLPTYASDTNAVVILDALDDVVTGPGEYDQHYRRVVRILRKEGREEGFFDVGLQRGEKLNSVHAWSVDSAGHHYELKDKDFEERSPYSEELYSDYHVRAAQVPAPDPGSVVAFEYQVHRHGWLNQLHWFFQEDVPIHEARFTLQLPAGWEYKLAWANAQPVAAEDAGREAQWTVHEVPGITEEERMPFPFSLAGHAEIAYFAPGATAVSSWNGVGQWYAQLTAGRRTASPEIQAEVRELTAGKTGFDSKVRALASFLQTEVRYVAIEIGIGGYQPHAAADVFHARYGDCKDKATLLSSMLGEVGIKSDYVLIDTYRGFVKPKVPSNLFNHAILAIQLPADVSSSSYHSVLNSSTGTRYLIFDPTDEYTPLGELRSDLQDTDALLVTDSGGELIHTPLLPPETNSFSRVGHFTLKPDGSLSGEVTETHRGDDAFRMRLILLHKNQQERVRYVEDELGDSLKGFALDNLTMDALEPSAKDLVVRFKVTVPQYAQLVGSLMLVRPRVLGVKSFDIDHRKPRLYPVMFHRVARQNDVFEIDLPPGYRVDDVPDPLKVNMGFAGYESKFDVADSKLRYSREYVVDGLSVPPDHFADLRKFEGSIGADENAVVILKRAE